MGWWLMSWSLLMLLTWFSKSMQIPRVLHPAHSVQPSISSHPSLPFPHSLSQFATPLSNLNQNISAFSEAISWRRPPTNS